MELGEIDDTAVTVWVARANSGEKTIVTAWSWRDKAEAWCAHELDVDSDAVTWREGGGTDPGISVAGHYEGDIVASLMQVEVMDPISLSKQYPVDMPSARDVLD